MIGYNQANPPTPASEAYEMVLVTACLYKYDICMYYTFGMAEDVHVGLLAEMPTEGVCRRLCIKGTILTQGFANMGRYTFR